MKQRWSLALAAVALVLVTAAAGAYIFAIYRLSHAFRFTAAQSSEVRTAFEGLLGQVLFEGGSPGPVTATQGNGMKALLAPTKNPTGPGLIDAYRRDPEKFTRYAKLFETATNAMKLGQAVQKNGGAYRLPMTSSGVVAPAAERLDAWGHQYCISSIGDTIAVVSGGPRVASFSCREQCVLGREIAEASRTLFQTASGEVVLVLKRDASKPTHVGR